MSDDLIKREDAIETAYQLRRKPNDEEWEDWLKSFNAIPSTDRPTAIYEYLKNKIGDIVDSETEFDAWFKRMAWHVEECNRLADRPQGEWIRTGRTNVYGGIEVQCSNCGDKVMVQHIEDEWFCRHCGADMGMKGADDEV